MAKKLLCWATALGAAIAGSGPPSRGPPDVQVWCGKAYMSTNASFFPGGWLDEPKTSSQTLLDLQLRPRMNLYLEGETNASFIIDTTLSNTIGQPFSNSSSTRKFSSNSSESFSIDITSGDVQLVKGYQVPVNSTSNEVSIDLSGLKSQVDAYNVTLTATASNGQKYAASTLLSYVPSKSNGSVARIDNLYGGLLAKKAGSDMWTPVFPYSYYVSWDWIQKTNSSVQKFKDEGYNIIHVVPDGGLPNKAFDYEAFGKFFDACDQAGLWVMYDMRWTYQNLTSVTEQVSLFKDHPSLLLWYTGDEPDGNNDPLDAPLTTYNHIRALDPHHPISLCLNCYNFHYDSYSAGADIILSDVYPIGNNATFSTSWHTPCNATYGDCGCDDCTGDGLSDVSERLDRFVAYQRWLGRAPKPAWGVPQAFGGEEYWSRAPTAAEEAAMALLSLNHGAKGIVAWTWPAPQELAAVTGRLARALGAQAVARFTLGAETRALRVEGGGAEGIDAAGWVVGREVLVSVVNTQGGKAGNVVLNLPEGSAAAIGDTVWGEDGWSVSDGKLVKQGMEGFEADVFIVSLA